VVYSNARDDLDITKDSSTGEVCASLDWDKDTQHYASPDAVSTEAEWRNLFPDWNGTGWNFTAHVWDDGRFNRRSGQLTHGDPMPTKLVVSSTDYYSWFTLPSADAEGRCNDESKVRYMVDTTPKSSFEAANNTCRRDADLLSAACVSGGAFDANSYIYGIFLYKFGYMTTLNTDSNSYIEVTNGVSSVSWPPPTPSYDSSTKICSNALIAASFHITVETTGSSGQAAPQVTSFVVYPTLGQLSPTHMDGSIETYQTWEVEFHSTSESYPTVPRSGNNGYINGDPVPSGSLSTSGSSSAILQTEGGLVVPSTNNAASPSMTCLDVANANSSLNFNSPSSSCCMISMTEAQLESACQASYTPTFPITTGTYIGIYGSADRYRTADWMQLPDPVMPSTSYDAPRSESAPYWDATTKTCYGITGGSLRLEFDWSYQGSYQFPQARIVAARQIWERQTWRHTTPGGSHQFPICVKTAWSEIQSSFRETELDTDLIYPVKVNFWGVSDLVQEIVLACVFFFVAWGLTLCTMFR